LHSSRKCRVIKMEGEKQKEKEGAVHNLNNYFDFNVELLFFNSKKKERHNFHTLTHTHIHIQKHSRKIAAVITLHK